MAGDKESYDLWGDEAPSDALVGIDRDSELVAKLQELFAEAGHVFKAHADGRWAVPGGYKDDYACRLNAILGRYPGLVARLLRLDNRLIKMVTHRALELQKDAARD